MNIETKDKLITIAENQQKVYDAGKKAGYDAFWDEYQRNGTRRNYQYGFGGGGWTDETFKPKYDITAEYANNMFTSASIADLKACLERSGVSLDFSNCVNSSAYIFQDSDIQIAGTLNFTSATSLNYTFYKATKLKSVDLLIFPDNGNTTFNKNYSFGQCAALEHIIFEGCIGQQNFNMQWSTKLDHESLMSIINCLQDKSSDTSGTVWAITIGATNKAKLTTEELEIAYQKGWQVN